MTEFGKIAVGFLMKGTNPKMYQAASRKNSSIYFRGGGGRVGQQIKNKTANEQNRQLCSDKRKNVKRDTGRSFAQCELFCREAWC